MNVQDAFRSGLGRLRSAASPTNKHKNMRHPQQKPIPSMARRQKRWRIGCAALVLLLILANTVAFEILQQLKFKLLTKLMVDDRTVGMANSFLRHFDERTFGHIAESPLRSPPAVSVDIAAEMSHCEDPARLASKGGAFCRQWQRGDRCTVFSLAGGGANELDVFLSDTEACVVMGLDPALGALLRSMPQMAGGFQDKDDVDVKFRSEVELGLLARELGVMKEVDVLNVDVHGAEWFLLNEIIESPWRQLVVHLYFPEQFDVEIVNGHFVVKDTEEKRGVVDPAAWLAYLQRYAHPWHFQMRGQRHAVAFFVKKDAAKATPLLLNESNVLWSKNWHQLVNCPQVPARYYSAGTESKFSVTELRKFFTKCSGLIWIRLGSFANNELERFIEEVLPFMENTFSLVTSDGDNRVPGGITNAQKLLDSPKLERWFTQNYDGSIKHAKLHPVPIGFDLHTQWNGLWSSDVNKNLHHMKRMRLTMRKRKNEILLDAMGMYKLRRDMDTAVGCVKHLHLGSLPINKLWNTYTIYRFGLSPHGNGLDCHRTWEMLFFGIIPIVKTSSLDKLYENLPVVILDEWDDVCDPEKFGAAYKRAEQFIQVPSEIFTTSYWIR